jgi:pimeloyl-ACP methyl ester carboxylesterase
MPLQQKPDILRRAGRPALAYCTDAGRGPTVVFFSGFMSDMSGKKVQDLALFCEARGQAMLRFDYRAHGQSEGVFAETGLQDWLDDALDVIATTQGPLLLVGSSMGGWIMLLAALALKERVVGIVGIAAAPDFTEDLVWNELSFADREKLMRDGMFAQPSAYSDQPYMISRKLIEDGRRLQLLGGPIAIDCPVHLLHGMRDGDVPYGLSLRIAEKLTTGDVTVTLIKDGDHRLSREADLAQIQDAVAALSVKAGF